MQGDKQKALDYFREMTKRKTIGHLALIQVKILPIYDNISNEPEFRKMIQIAGKKIPRRTRKNRKTTYPQRPGTSITALLSWCPPAGGSPVQ
jgi:hypothetical protein